MPNTIYLSAGLPVAKDSGQSPSSSVNTAFLSAGLPAEPITAVPLSLTGASVNLESPYSNGDSVDTAAASGGSTPYSYATTSQSSDTEVLKVTGTLTPDATGYYIENGTYNSEKAYEREDGSYWIWWQPSFAAWILSATLGDQSDYWYNDTLAGDYTDTTNTSGTATVALAEPFAVNSSTGAITVADADALTVGHTWTITVQATDANSDTASDDWVVTLVSGSTATSSRRYYDFLLAGAT